ncbi:MAG: DUF3850 domain-containing protein [Clostridia bacterium]|nr:DUF3850 domain-containing protein [Clostridia bacterium]
MIRKMKLHNLKIDLEAIDLKIRGVKNWEIRYDDRGYSAGDVLCEREYDRKTETYGCKCAVEKIVSVMPREAVYGLREGFCILITQPLFYGDYEEIKDLIAYGDDCFKLIGAIAKMFTCEDYTVWGNQNRYNWNVVADYVLKGKPFDTICCEVVRK